MEVNGKLWCPRRGESPMALGVDFDKNPGDVWEDRKEGYLCCSYCGSMHPDDFFKYVEAQHEIGPTDKNYKAYVDGVRGPGKFYFQHLDEAGKARFMQLHNDRVMKIGVPHHFYVTPFFCAIREKNS